MAANGSPDSVDESITTSNNFCEPLPDGYSWHVGWGVLGKPTPILDEGHLSAAKPATSAGLMSDQSATTGKSQIEALLDELLPPAGINQIATSQGNGPAYVSQPASPVSSALTIDQLPGSIGHRQWIHGVHLLRESVTLFVAPGGQSKSTLVLSMLVSLAAGKDFLGLHIHGGPHKVLFVSAEDSKAELTRRIRAICQRFGITDSDLRDRFFAISPEERQFTLLQAVGSAPTINVAGVQALRDELDAIKPDVLAIDPLLKLTGGVNINDNSAAALLQGTMMDLAHRHKMAVAITHHSAKGANLRSQDAAMGAASLTNFARAQFSLEPMTNEEARAFGIKHDVGSYFRLSGTKQNYSAAAEHQYYRRSSVVLPNAEPPTYPNGDSVGIVEPVSLIASATASASGWSAGIVSAAISAIKAAAVPLQPGKVEHRMIIAAAIKNLTGEDLVDGEVKRLIDHLVATGKVTDAPVKVKRADANGYYTRKGLTATQTTAGEEAATNHNEPHFVVPAETPDPPGRKPQCGSGS